MWQLVKNENEQQGREKTTYELLYHLRNFIKSIIIKNKSKYVVDKKVNNFI